MKKTILLLVLLLLGLLFIGCTSPPITKSTGLIGFTKLDDSKATTEGVNEIVLANNQFAIDYYNQLDKENKNIFFSPFSISTAIAMTYEGTDGKTAEEIRKVFYFPQNNEQRKSSFAKIYNTLNNELKNEKITLNIANAIWKEKEYTFKKDFLETINKYYYGKTNSVDFKNAPEPSRKKINEWVEKQTNNKIQKLIPGGVISTYTKMVLTNAIYFKGKWTNLFEQKNTKEKDFLVSEDKNVKTQMMYQTDNFKYYEDTNFQYLQMNYKGNKISMLVILPKDKNGKTIYDFNIPTAKKIPNVINSLKTKEVKINFPKIELRTNYSLKKDLQKMGMKEVFTNNANFSKMDPKNKLKVSEIYHKTYLKVDEEGTEAAAATAIVIAGTTSVPLPPKVFNANHPFAFIIKENKTGEILFIGKIVNPQSSE